MKQRLGIALAMLPDSEFIILDEPTNGLDPAGIVEIRNIICEYNRKFGTTIIITSHLLHEIEQICHEVVIINHGEIIAEGEIGTLLHARKVLIAQCDRPEEAATIVRHAAANGQLPVCDVGIVGGELHVELTSDCAAELNRKLNEQGIGVSRLTMHRKSLEDFFMEKTDAGHKNA